MPIEDVLHCMYIYVYMYIYSHLKSVHEYNFVKLTCITAKIIPIFFPPEILDLNKKYALKWQLSQMVLEASLVLK